MQKTRPATCAILGGGATLDVAGFAASTYKRGLPIIFIPTTLMGMIDACIGGKTAIDHGGAKNIIGTFAPARYTYINLAFLRGEAFAKSKVATIEAVKFALLNRPRLIKNISSFAANWVPNQAKELSDLVQSLAKLRIEFNKIPEAPHLGHTIGHAIESLGLLSHAEAVTIGLHLETQLALDLGFVSAEVLSSLDAVIDQIAFPPNLWPRIDPRRLAGLCERQKTYDGRAHSFYFYEGEHSGDLQIRKTLIPAKDLQKLLAKVIRRS
jgi:3-dehydroquinate synthase